ncbi:hypothetical protein [Desulfovibrio sp.]|uniref:hypothetical protein n=1 Tax=Desulfovibrio sp. TaxID=885 RepID=UPI0030787122
MTTIYFKTIFSSPSEIPFILMNIMEGYSFIDKFIISEANYTHTGSFRDYSFNKYRDFFTQFEEKIIYIPADIKDRVIHQSRSTDNSYLHINEDIIRDCFEDYIKLNNDDIIISADADEVIFRQIYPLLFKYIRRNIPLIIPLHQFFYRINYLWEDIIFKAPIVSYASFYLKRPRPHRWRDEGKTLPFIGGCHFSWQLTIDQMIHKLQTYAHHDIYGHLADPQLLENAVKEKRYIFDPNRKFSIRELNPNIDRAYYPRSFYRIRNIFEQLRG